MNRIILSLWCGTYRCLHEKMKPSGLTNKSHDLAKRRLMHFLDAFNRPRRSSYKLWINKKKDPRSRHRLLFSHASGSRGERRNNAGKKVRLNRVSNSQPPGHESDTLTTEPPGRGEKKDKLLIKNNFSFSLIFFPPYR